MKGSDPDIDALCVAHAQVEELTAQPDTFKARAEQDKMGCEELAARIRELEVDAERRDGELA